MLLPSVGFFYLFLVFDVVLGSVAGMSLVVSLLDVAFLPFCVAFGTVVVMSFVWCLLRFLIVGLPCLAFGLQAFSHRDVATSMSLHLRSFPCHGSWLVFAPLPRRWCAPPSLQVQAFSSQAVTTSSCLVLAPLPHRLLAPPPLRVQAFVSRDCWLKPFWRKTAW